MNGQYLCNRQITVSYAYKKDTKGELGGGSTCVGVCRCVSVDSSIADTVQNLKGFL